MGSQIRYHVPLAIECTLKTIIGSSTSDRNPFMARQVNIRIKVNRLTIKKNPCGPWVKISIHQFCKSCQFFRSRDMVFRCIFTRFFIPASVCIICPSVHFRFRRYRSGWQYPQAQRQRQRQPPQLPERCFSLFHSASSFFRFVKKSSLKKGHPCGGNLENFLAPQRVLGYNKGKPGRSANDRKGRLFRTLSPLGVSLFYLTCTEKLA